jgi:chorismate mutase / prephenate dehydratase
LGPEGTFSHILARRMFGRPADCRRCGTLEAVVERVADDPGSFAVLPVENSSGGSVEDSLDVLIRHAGRVAVVAEAALDVRTALLRRGRGKLRVVFSHSMQIRHHAEWLQKRFPGVVCKEVGSTAEAARRAALMPASAALASPGAAEIYGLEVVETPPAPRGGNVTHFFAVRHGPPEPCTDPAPTKTALVVTLPNVCGSLHAFLGPFARHGVSLTRLVSRPVRGKPQTYVFFVVIEGDPRHGPVAKALRRAAGLAASMVELGSFPCGARHRS